jgi:acetyl-CoA C-acetyltransferase
MSAIADNTPVVVGVGQWSERIGEPGYAHLSPMDLAGKALGAAMADCAANGNVAAAIDTIAAIRQFEISTPAAVAPFGRSDNPPRSIAARVGADPARAILEVVGGQGPQRLVGELASEIAAGRGGLAAIVGSEAISTALSLAAGGDKPDWSEEVGGQLDDRGFGMGGMLDRALIDHGLAAPIPVYALFDNARRAARGTGLASYRREIGELFAPFSTVAAGNPHAAAPVARSAAELAEVTERNRVVAEPYTRMTVARDQVNQAAAILIASAGKARALGIPEDRWVHIHAVVDAKEASVLAREDLATSPAAIAAVREALALAGIAPDDLRYIDLYSCFAIAVTNLTDALGIAVDDPRGLTLTGGLPFFGGAGNNYSAHAIVEAVARLRADPGAYALVGANGGYMSKYAAGIYSTRPADWSAPRRRSLADQPAAVPVAESFAGEATVETYTVVPRKGGALGAVIARTDAGARLVATAADAEALAVLAAGEPFGRRILVAPADGRHTFRFAAA